MANQENLLFPPDSLRHTPIGVVKMPRMYTPRLTPEECQALPWSDFRDGLRPKIVASLSDGLEIALVDKTSQWTPADFCGFVGGAKDIYTIEDLSPQQGIDFLKFHQGLAMILHGFCCRGLDHYGHINVVFGFNPDDYQLGAHSIKRLHTHIYTPNHWLTEGTQDSDPLRKIASWKDLPWFERLKFIEPFSKLYYDRVSHLVSNGLFSGTLSRKNIEHNYGYISLYFKTQRFPDIFPEFQRMYTDLHTQHTAIESIFTDRILDDYNRYIPVEKKFRALRLKKILNGSSWMSNQSIDLLTTLTQKILRASPRDPANAIKTASQAWITKGFAGSILLDFLRDSNETRVDFFPRVITTSAPEKAIYGSGRPTVIQRVETKPTEPQRFEAELFNFASNVACGCLSMCYSGKQ